MQEKLSHLSEYISIEDYHARLSAGKITCREVVQQYLQRINETKKLNAFVEVFADESLQRATQLDEQRKQEDLKGKLHGVVIALKDVISYKGHSLTAASHILENFKAVYSATAVEKHLMKAVYPVAHRAARQWLYRQVYAWYHWAATQVDR